MQTHGQIDVFPLSGGQMNSFVLVTMRMSYSDNTINFLLDTGVRYAQSKNKALNLLEKKLHDVGVIDFCIVSHAHRDHVGLLNDAQALHERMFNAPFPTYMSPKTFELVKKILHYPVGVRVLDQVFGVPHEYHNVTIKFMNAGHTNDSVMSLIDVNGIKVFYTGDFSTIKKRGMLTNIDPVTLGDLYKDKISLLITEATGASQGLNLPNKKTAYPAIVQKIKDVCLVKNSVLAIYSASNPLEEAFELAYAIQNYSNNNEIKPIRVYALDVPEHLIDFNTNKFSMLIDEGIDITDENPISNSNPYVICNMEGISIKDLKKKGTGFGYVVVFPAPIFWTDEIKDFAMNNIENDPRNHVFYLGYPYFSEHVLDLIKRKQQNFEILNFSNHAPEGGIVTLIARLNPKGVYVTHYKDSLTNSFSSYLKKHFPHNSDNPKLHAISTADTGGTFPINEPSSIQVKIPITQYEMLASKGNVTQQLQLAIRKKKRSVMHDV